MLLALITPELVILWAMRQRVMARTLAQKHHGVFVYFMRSKLLTDVSVSCLEHRWTEVHGFFAVMGGFMLFDDDKEDGTIKPNDLKSYLNAGEIEITKKEIEDRSKGDTLTKGLVIIQTGWFILQCVARRAEHLPVTELELVTLAFATLSFVTYWLWWHKPLNVQCPYPVRRKMSRETGEVEDEHKGVWVRFKKGDAFVQVLHTFGPIMAKALDAIRYVVLAIGPACWGAVGCVRKNGAWSIWYGMKAIYYVVKPRFNYIFSPFTSMVWGEAGDLAHGAKRVPTFYAGDLKRDDPIGAANAGTAISASAIMATIFGALHLIAWSFYVPSYLEQLLWRICSLIITFVPPLWFVHGQLMGSPNCKLPSWMRKLVLILALRISPIPYVIARVTLLVLAFMSLRSLPPSAYQAVYWTTLIPHI